LGVISSIISIVDGTKKYMMLLQMRKASPVLLARSQADFQSLRTS